MSGLVYKEGNKASTAHVKSLQLKLVDIGYLDPYYLDANGNTRNAVDGVAGGRTKGAMVRYMVNKPSATDKLLDWMKSF